MPDETTIKKNGASTTKEVSESIERMRETLRSEYGEDYAFTVCVHGKVVAASNLIFGEIFADY